MRVQGVPVEPKNKYGFAQNWQKNHLGKKYLIGHRKVNDAPWKNWMRNKLSFPSSSLMLSWDCGVTFLKNIEYRVGLFITISLRIGVCVGT